VTKDGKLHLDDAKVREGVVKAIAYTITADKEGYVPSSAINWNDSDNNNAFHSKLIVMDIDGTISTEVAIIDNEQDYDDIVTMGLPLDNDGKPVPNQVVAACGLVPKGAKNVEVAKDFLKYLIQPEITGSYLKVGFGRNIPAMVSILKAIRGGPTTAPQGLCRALSSRPDRARMVRLQPGLCRSPQPACLGRRLGRHHPQRHVAPRRGGKGLQMG
jgi:ABC-type glycerol-3-phosphate transport system substrate-binding protein